MATTGKFWVTEPHQIAPDRTSDNGRAANPAFTLLDRLKTTVQKHGNEKAMGLKRAVNVSC